MFGIKRKLARIAVTGAVAAGVAYLFDPKQGRARRAQLMDQAAGLLRRGHRDVQKRAEYVKGQAEGLRHAGAGDDLPENDEVLTAKVRSEVLGPGGYPTGRIDVNVADGVVELRGTCDDPDEINKLEQEVRKVTGVLDVRNFLHLPGTPAPNKVDAREI